MLPGFRFLFGAIVLSMSLLIFGLGAAALLRAAHEEFASIPARRAPPEIMFAQQSDARPTLAILRVEPSETDRKILNPPAADDVAIAAPAIEQPATASAALEQPAAEADKIAAPADGATPAEISPRSEPAKPDVSTADIPAQAETAAAAPSRAVDTKVAAIAEVTPAAAAAPEQASAPIDDSTRIAETKIATLGGPPVTIETQALPKIAPAVVKKQVKHTFKRRRIVRRAPVTLQASQKPADPFAQPIGR